MRPVARRVLIYCVDAGRLLVLRHLDFPAEQVGLQVPGGTVKPGEAPRAAALRELEEETGRRGFRIVRRLGTSRYDVAPYRDEIQHRAFYLTEPTVPLPERWVSAELHDGEAPPTRLECFWIPLAAGHVLQSGQGALLGRL